MNRGRVDAFLQKMVTGSGCWCEMPLCQSRTENAVDFLWKRQIALARSQTSFNVSNRYLVIKGRQCPSQCGGGITLNHDAIRFGDLEIVIKPAQASGHDMHQVLIRTHDVQIHIGLQAKRIHHLIQHILVLTGPNDVGAESLGLSLCSQNQGCKFDSLRSRAHDNG